MSSLEQRSRSRTRMLGQMYYEHVHSHPSLLRQTFSPHKYLPDLYVRTILLECLHLLVMLTFYSLWVFFTYYYFRLLLFWDISRSPELPQIRCAAEDDLEVLIRCWDCWCTTMPGFIASSHVSTLLSSHVALVTVFYSPKDMFLYDFCCIYFILWL